MSRDRISLALRDADRTDLVQLAASRQIPSARLAGELVAEGLDRARRLQRYAREQTAARARLGDLAGVDADIHAALTTPGVVAALVVPEEETSAPALRALTYLRDVSAWLDDPRPVGDRPRPPRLHDPVGSALHTGPIAAALDYAGGADGRTLHGSEAAGSPAMSDKQQLSDMTPPEAAGEDDHDA